MTGPSALPIRIGDWRVDPLLSEISRAGETVRVEARAMRLLQVLAARAGEVVRIEELLDQVWPGVIVTSDSVYQAVTSLRRQLGDDPKRPTYIATVPRLGYRLIAAVGSWDEASADSDLLPEHASGVNASATATALPRRRGIVRARKWIGLGVAAALLVIAGMATYVATKNASNTSGLASTPPKSIAVLPFLDLTTQEMNEEYFADGMTEELIDHLGKLPGMRVPGASSSFFYKEKQVPVADVARQLGVAYVLDGSVRKAGTTFRVAARLVRADDGFVVWTETYDRTMGDVLVLQSDVAGRMAEAIAATLNTPAAAAKVAGGG